jgi:hypothetical protein
VGEGARFSFAYGSCIEMGFPWPFDSLEILSTWKRLYDPLFALILGDIVRRRHQPRASSPLRGN